MSMVNFFITSLVKLNNRLNSYINRLRNAGLMEVRFMCILLPHKNVNLAA